VSARASTDRSLVRSALIAARVCVERRAALPVAASLAAAVCALPVVAHAAGDSNTVAAPVAVGDPLPVRDQNPLVRGVYLPLPSQVAGDVAGWQLSTGLQWSNTVNLDTSARESLVVDEESAELDLAIARNYGAWRFRAGLPVTWRGAGSLDGFIDSWHRFFGLPRGDRPLLAKNAYDVRYARTGRPTVVVRDGTSLGDLQLEAGRVVSSGERGELVAWLGVEAPTGSESRSTGNGGVDVAGWLSGRVGLAENVDLSGQVGVVAIGGDRPLPAPSTAAFGTATLGWRALPTFTAIVQIDAHSRLASDADAKFLQAPTILTLGGRLRMKSGAVFEAGVSEDIAVDRSPDVVFHFGLRWAVGR
jgi:hypothetical protein